MEIDHFLQKAKKPNLFKSICKNLNLNNLEIEEFEKLVNESTLKHNKLPYQISSYLLENPLAQQALRKASSSGVKDKTWKKVIDIIENEDK